MKIAAIIFLCAVSATVLSSCNRLSDEAKAIVGKYYEPAISETTPTMELNADGTCVIRAISPGVLSYAVHGNWNVLRDTLFVESDGRAVEIRGDSTLVGHVADHLARPVVDFTGSELTLKFHDCDKVYVRR